MLRFLTWDVGCAVQTFKQEKCICLSARPLMVHNNSIIECINIIKGWNASQKYLWKKINNKKPHRCRNILLQQLTKIASFMSNILKGLKLPWFGFVILQISFFILIILVCSYIILATSKHYCICDKNPRRALFDK